MYYNNRTNNNFNMVESARARQRLREAQAHRQFILGLILAPCLLIGPFILVWLVALAAHL